MQKKILAIKLILDVTLFNNAKIEAYKELLRTQFALGGVEATFEVVTEEMDVDAFVSLLMAKADVAIDERLACTAEETPPPMDSLELSEGQSNVLRGFFDRQQ